MGFVHFIAQLYLMACILARIRFLIVLRERISAALPAHLGVRPARIRLE
jgi:hypothetical protein